MVLDRAAEAEAHALQRLQDPEVLSTSDGASKLVAQLLGGAKKEHRFSEHCISQIALRLAGALS